MPELTIQLVTWNSARHLARSLPILRRLNQTQATIRVIDNASTDQSLQLVRAALPQADVLSLPANQGFAGGHNAGLARCTTPYVLVLNPDVELQWEGIAAALSYLSDPNVGAVQGKLYRQGNIIDSAGIGLSYALNGYERGAGEKDVGHYNQLKEIQGVTGACALYRLEALREVAGSHGEIFDEKFWAYKEDVDLSWRLRRAGWKLLYVPTTTGIHPRSLRRAGRFGWGFRPRQILERLRDPRTRYSWRNWVWLWVKNASWRELVWHSPGILGRLVVMVAGTLVYWPLAAVWGETIAGLPAMIAKRTHSG